jgi:hypothetical protein
VVKRYLVRTRDERFDLNKGANIGIYATFSVAHERLHVQVIFSNLGQKSVTRS